MRRIAFTRLSHLTRPPDAAEAFSAGSGPLGLFVQPAPSRSPPRLALFLHVTLRTSSQLASFCAFAPRPASPRPHPPRRSRELGSFCIIDSGIPAGPPPIGFVCTTSHRPLWHKLGLFGASRPSDSSAGSSAGRVPPGGIGFVLPGPIGLVQAVNAQGNTYLNPSGQERIVTHFTDGTYESRHTLLLSGSVTLL
jgi:hypothetical protein